MPRRPGYPAMWVGVSLECLEFAVFFAVYFVARWHHPEAFQTGAARLWTGAGLGITVAMVSAGWLLTRMLEAARADRLREARRWLAAALLVGAAYPVLKALEWQWNQAHGNDVSAGLFVIVYYYLGLNHLVHASWGLLGMGWGLVQLTRGAYTADDHRGLEALATYWHATDLVWLMIFALFYAYA